MDTIRNYGLSFISNEDLYNHVKETVLEYSFKIDLDDFNKNIIDPIKLTFDSLVYNQTIQQTLENEVVRQLDKTNSNIIGYFHQNIFKYFDNGWSVPVEGYDIINESRKIFCELKNKHNTMNSSSAAKTYMRMQNTLIRNPRATCILVEVIAKRSQNIPWIVTLEKERQPLNENIRRVSIDKFYDIVTGEVNSFASLCKILPLVISDVVKQNGSKSKQNTVFRELNSISDNLAVSLFMLAFSRYEGFTDFNFIPNE